MGVNCNIISGADSDGAGLIPTQTLPRVLLTIAVVIVALVPVGYLSVIFGVLIHEVIGHGLTSLAVGGDFLGFQIDYDGMGYAMVPYWENPAIWQQVAILAGGMVATTVFGLTMMYGAFLLRRRPWAALPPLVLSCGILLDGLPYLFWNAAVPQGPGDIARILMMVDSLAMRIALIIIGGVAMAVVTWVFTALMFLLIQGLATNSGELNFKARLILLLLLGIIPGVYWFSFGWDQLVPGVNNLPNYVGAGLHVASALSLMWLKPKPLQLKSTKGLIPATLTCWSLTAIAIASVAIWFREGVYWGGHGF